MKGYFKCRNCRHLLDLQTDSVCTNHNVVLSDLPLDNPPDQVEFTTCEDNHYFLLDSKLREIDWIVDELDKADWTKGEFHYFSISLFFYFIISISSLELHY